LRQKNHPFEINLDTPKDVSTLSSNLSIPVTVRINPLDDSTPTEVDQALSCGAKTLMLPMAQTVVEVKKFLEIVDNRAQTIVQIENPFLASQAEDLASLNWDYAYIGLNDLMVASGKSSIWEALIDGTAEFICNHLKNRKYGFGGTTILGGGEPIMNVLILQELIRLGGSISVMRRTFKKELLDRDLALEMKALREFVSCTQRRGSQAVQQDHEHLLRVIKSQLYPTLPKLFS
jgi:hypothetical protein